MNLWTPNPGWDALVSDFQPDLIHANGIRSAAYAQAVGRHRGIPVAFHARIADSDPMMDLFLLEHVSAVFCVSRAVRARFPDGVGRAIRLLLYNAVDVGRFEMPGPAADQLRRRWIGDGNRLVGVIGELSPVKGQDRALAAAVEVVRRCPDSRFVFVGDAGPDADFVRDLEERVRSSSDLRARVVFAGFESDMASVYHAFDLVLVPSRSEGFGRVLIEAGAARRPVVAGDLPATRELIAGESSQVCVDFDDPVRTGERVVEILTGSRPVDTLVASQHRFVGERFGLEAHGRRLVELYERIRSRSGAA